MDPSACLIAAVDLGAGAQGVIRRAARLAGHCRAALVVVHVVEYHAGFECGHVPFQTPDQVRTAMVRQTRAHLVGLLHHLGLPEAQVVVRSGRPAEVIAALAEERRARYIVTGPLKWGAIGKLAALAKDPRVRRLGCDVVNVGGDGKRFGEAVSDWLLRWMPLGK